MPKIQSERNNKQQRNNISKVKHLFSQFQFQLKVDGKVYVPVEYRSITAHSYESIWSIPKWVWRLEAAALHKLFDELTAEEWRFDRRNTNSKDN